MENQFAKGTTTPLPCLDLDPTDPADLLACGRSKLEERDTAAAGEHLLRAYQLALERNEADLIRRASIYLGLLEMENADLQQAKTWFEEARDCGVARPDDPGDALLQALLSLVTSHAAAREAERRIVVTRERLVEEIRALEAEAREKAAHLRRHMAADRSDGKGPRPAAAAPEARAGEPALAVQFLGSFRVRLASGEPLSLCANRKGQALFKILATKPHQRFHREVLLDLLWRDLDPAVARAKLHIAVSRLRRALQKAGLTGEVLVLEDDCYFLEEGLTIRSDVERFEAHIEAGLRFEGRGEDDRSAVEYETALRLYRGPYLAEVLGEDWPVVQRARLEEQFLILLSKLASWHFNQGRYERCSIYCQRILQYDNLREDVYRTLMRCLARSGQRNQALRLYQELGDLLEVELAVEPMRETRELAERILQEQSV